MRDQYFERLCDMALKKDKNSYVRLCQTLYERNFEYTLDMDENRLLDGLRLREDILGDPGEYVYKPCSVLEVMVALCRRCWLETFAESADDPEQVDELFKLMLENSGLIYFTDSRFDIYMVNDIINNILDRKYEPNGEGSFFYIPNIDVDMRTVDIWYQAAWYINSIYN